MNGLNILFLCRELPPHPNVVQMFGVSSNGSQYVIVMEYCAGGISFFVTFIWVEILRNDKIDEFFENVVFFESNDEFKSSSKSKLFDFDFVKMVSWNYLKYFVMREEHLTFEWLQ
jgi:hypothetical protein